MNALLEPPPARPNLSRLVLPSRARFAVAALFFINGAIVGTWVSRIPAIHAALRLNDGVFGLSLLAMASGALVAMPGAGWLSERFGSDRICRVTALGMVALLPTLALAPNAVVFASALFLFGAVHGGLDVSMNAQAVAVERSYGRPIMSSFHALFSAGGLAGAALGGAVAARGAAPPLHFGVTAALLLAATALVLPWLMTAAAPEPGGGRPAIAFGRPTRALAAIGAVAFCCMMGEGAMADWSAIFLRRVLHASEGWAAGGYAAFSVTMAATRFFGDGIAARLGPARLTRSGGTVAAIGLGLALLGGSPALALIGFAFVGAGLATVVPLAFSAAGRAPGVSPGIALATVTTLGYTGFLAGPPLIGFAAQAVGLHHALAILAGTTALIVALAGNVQPPSAEDARSRQRAA